ncbi:MAG: anthranilate phosphoribosyltransferase [Thermodesulfobacteriota bacterium]
MIKEAIAKVVDYYDLKEDEMVGVMDEIMSGNATQAQIAAFITALRMKGETVDEITGAARVMRSKATKVNASDRGKILVDSVGTGGDASGTFNVSTTSSFIIAGAGVPVAKHGNRSISSHCGSADVLEALGVDLNLTAKQIGQCVRRLGIGFMFAPVLHSAMRYAIGPRKEIGVRTLFNLLGPLTNPAGANVYILGVYSLDLLEKLAGVLARLEVKRALVVWGEGGIDEITVTGKTSIADLKKGGITCYSVSPEDVGFRRASLVDIRGGQTAEESAVQLRSVLEGKPGPCLDMALMNAGAALMAAGEACDLKEGVILARQTVGSGAALRKLEELIAYEPT